MLRTCFNATTAQLNRAKPSPSNTPVVLFSVRIVTRLARTHEGPSLSSQQHPSNTPSHTSSPSPHGTPTPRPRTRPVNILPINLAIPALQNRPVNSRAGLAERHGPPLAVLDGRELHSATHGLGDAELAAQEGHFQVVLLLLPG